MILFRSKSPILLGRLAAKSKSSILLSSSSLLTPRYSFTSDVVDPSPETLFVVKYLIDSIGLSSSEVTKVSKFITHMKSPLRPHYVVELFRKNGFTDTDIRRIVFSHPRLLRANPDSTLKPKLEALRELGFSETQIIKLVRARPLCLTVSYRNARHRIEFLSGFLASNDDLIQAISNNISVLTSDFEKKIMPSITFLRECQFSNKRIGSLMTDERRIIGRNVNSLKTIAKRVVELGFPYGSGLFYHAFCCLSRISSDTVDAKVKLLGSLGFSRAEIFAAILKQPHLLSLSEKNICETVDFLVKEVGCDLSYLSNYPVIISLSLPKRLIPRNYVMQLLKQKELLKINFDFHYIFSLTEQRFLERFIIPFKIKMPELHDVYLSASSGKCMN